MEKKYTNRSAFKLLRMTGIYAAAAFAICFIVLFSLNSSIVFAATTGAQAAANTANAKASAGNAETPAPTSANKPVLTLKGVPAGAQDIAFSFDDKYCTYMYQSKLYVKDMKTGGTLKAITGNAITSPVLMSDRDILLYFTPGSGTITLNTYNIDNGQSTKQTSFSYPAGSKVKAVTYSNATNLVYVNIEQTKNGSETDAVYLINIMKNVQTVSLSTVVNNMVLLGKTNSLYYNNAQNTVYMNGKPVSGLQKSKVIGRDAEDRVYAQSANSAGAIYILENGKLFKTLTLPDTNVNKYYADQKGVYAVYSGYLVNLTGDMQSKLQYDSGLEFLGIGGSNAYFRDAGGDIVGLPSSIG